MIEETGRVIIKDKHEEYYYDWFATPRFLFDLRKNKKITQAELKFFILLISFDNICTRQPNSWFWRRDKDFYETRFISKSSVIKARRSLGKKKIIDFRKGYSHHATYYRILLEDYCYRGSHFGIKGNQRFNALVDFKT